MRPAGINHSSQKALNPGITKSGNANISDTFVSQRRKYNSGDLKIPVNLYMRQSLAFLEPEPICSEWVSMFLRYSSVVFCISVPLTNLSDISPPHQCLLWQGAQYMEGLGRTIFRPPVVLVAVTAEACTTRNSFIRRSHRCRKTVLFASVGTYTHTHTQLPYQHQCMKFSV